jgi:hypothetical protein
LAFNSVLYNNAVANNVIIKNAIILNFIDNISNFRDAEVVICVILVLSKRDGGLNHYLNTKRDGGLYKIYFYGSFLY